MQNLQKLWIEKTSGIVSGDAQKPQPVIDVTGFNQITNIVETILSQHKLKFSVANSKPSCRNGETMWYQCIVMATCEHAENNVSSHTFTHAVFWWTPASEILIRRHLALLVASLFKPGKILNCSLNLWNGMRNFQVDKSLKCQQIAGELFWTKRY